MISLKLISKCLCVTFFLLIGCDLSDPESQETLGISRNATIGVYTDGTNKTWKATEARLSNEFFKEKTLDISSNFSVLDDEFIFSEKDEKLILQWKKRRNINLDATINGEVDSDSHSTFQELIFDFIPESSTELVALDRTASLRLNPDNSISFHLDFSSGKYIDWILDEKAGGDYLILPQGTLEFSTKFLFKSIGINGGSPGIIGSYQTNKIYIASRDFVDFSSPSFEQIWAYDIDDNNLSQIKTYVNDYISKQVQIQDDKLIVFGGHFVNEYQIESMALIKSTNHGKNLTRFGSTEIDGIIYIIGGDLNNTEQGKILKWEPQTKSLSDFAILPKPKVGARGTIVDDHLYVFGGGSQFNEVNASNDILKINMKSKEVVGTFQLPKPIQVSFVDRIENLIYVAGSSKITSNNNTYVEFFIGVYNTLDDTFKEIPTNLSQFKPTDSIEGMSIFKGKIYVIFKDPNTEFYWSFMSAELP